MVTIGGESHPILTAEHVPGRIGSRIDQGTRSQIAMAARLLRSLRAPDGDVEIALHEIARRLERMADTGRPCRPLNRVVARMLDSLAT